MGLISGQGAKTPEFGPRPKTPNTKQKQYWKKFNKDLKKVVHINNNKNLKNENPLKPPVREIMCSWIGRLILNKTPILLKLSYSTDSIESVQPKSKSQQVFLRSTSWFSKLSTEKQRTLNLQDTLKKLEDTCYLISRVTVKRHSSRKCGISKRI